MDITKETAAAYFRALWPVYTSQPLAAVELFDFAASCPFRGCINWTAGGWHVLADTSAGVDAGFTTAMHELGHVVNGDLRPGMVHRRTVDERRALALGHATPTPPEQQQRATARVQSRAAAYGEHLDRAEVDADGWAYAKAAAALSVLAFRDSIAEAVQVMRRWFAG